MPTAAGSVRVMLLAAVSVTGAGCQALTPTALTASSFSRLPFVSLGERYPEDRGGQVVEAVAVWQPGEGRDMQGLPARGFAGQILFFAAGSPEPVPVRGDVRIYVFDDAGDEASNSKPLHVFEFKDGAWEKYRHETNLGETFQVFIPYTRRGGHRAVCSLRLRYTDPEGRTLLSDSAEVILGGTPHPAPPDVRDDQVATPTAAGDGSRAPETDSPSPVSVSLRPSRRRLVSASRTEPVAEPPVGPASDRPIGRETNPTDGLRVYSIPLGE
ncbi:MAG: hypothetical protein AAF532_03390 [Planctomycetota bacterium]